MLITRVGIAIRTMAKATTIMSMIIGGLIIFPYESFSLCCAVEVCFPVDDGGVTFEAFVKIAASGELGGRPRSSVITINSNSKYILVSITVLINGKSCISKNRKDGH